MPIPVNREPRRPHARHRAVLALQEGLWWPSVSVMTGHRRDAMMSLGTCQACPRNGRSEYLFRYIFPPSWCVGQAAQVGVSKPYFLMRCRSVLRLMPNILAVWT